MRFFGIQSEKYIFFPTLYPYTIGVPGKWYFLEHISARDTLRIRKGYARDMPNAIVTIVTNVTHFFLCVLFPISYRAFAHFDA